MSLTLVLSWFFRSWRDVLLVEIFQPASLYQTASVVGSSSGSNFNNGAPTLQKKTLYTGGEFSALEFAQKINKGVKLKIFYSVVMVVREQAV